jgi:hypothetical protein
MHLLLWVFVLAPSALMLTRAELQTVYEWKYLDFLWESDEQKQNAIGAGEYNLSRVLPSDLALAKGILLFNIFICSCT